MLQGNWNYPTSVKFGAGRIRELPDVVKAAGIKRPLLVTDPGLAKLPMVTSAVRANEAAGLPTAVFSDIKPNPVERNIEDGLKAFRSGKHDGVIAFGGGSALDAGKAIAFLSGQTRPIWDFEDVGDNWTRADPAGIRPTVAVPTTSGTGSEVGRVSVVGDEVNRKKRLIFHPRIMPVTVIEDPELTIGLPAHITAATGMDALAHAFEAYCVPVYHPMADGVALEGMRLIKEWLPVVTHDGKNIDGRGHMMAAATMGATAFQKGLGAIHSLSHTVGALYDKHHGLLNAVFFPYVIVFNRSAIGDKMTHLARFLGLPKPGFEGVLDWVMELRKTIGIPHSLAELNVDDSKLDKMVADAVADPTAPTNPLPLDAGSARRLYQQALEGRLA
ncbi:MAG TPA: iron-containing alcohol dehydrogenase [Stellaceae bacterium]|jgi:alcohol dehydrogenase class IV|nr:iron-containing alcohol dehydrogenase [Stellaceae bacterium]